MPLDNVFFENFISFFETSIQEVFNEDMINILKECNFKYRGFFRLSYQYLPYNYKIIIENEFRAFSMTIVDSENAWCHVKNLNNNLDKTEITESILLLKRLLEQNDFTFYFEVDDKLYRKNANGVKRVKDLKELLDE